MRKYVTVNVMNKVATNSYEILIILIIYMSQDQCKNIPGNSWIFLKNPTRIREIACCTFVILNQISFFFDISVYLENLVNCDTFGFSTQRIQGASLFGRWSHKMPGGANKIDLHKKLIVKKFSM